MSLRDKILAEAYSFLNTPYHHQGRLKGVGIDCAMLLIEVYRNVGLIPNIDPRPYPRDWHLHRDEERYLGWVKQFGTEVNDPQQGDVALFKFGRCISHGAIVVNWPVVIHSYITDGCVLCDATKGAMKGRIQSFYRIVPEE
jgi:cell wall-associated NlpC family hydrolase